jgi:hypothetical protein
MRRRRKACSDALQWCDAKQSLIEPSLFLTIVRVNRFGVELRQASFFTVTDFRGTRMRLSPTGRMRGCELPWRVTARHPRAFSRTGAASG